MNVIQIFAGRASNGQVVHEELTVRKIDDCTYELLASPCLAENVAKGDLIRIHSSEAPVEIVRRGGNVCVQMFVDGTLTPEERTQIEQSFHSTLQGSVDGQTEQSMCFSIPIAVGFQSIEHFFNALSTANPSASWSYGNVYGVDGTTPLNWWSGNESD